MSAASSSTTSPSTSSTTNIANTNNSSTTPAIYECLERLTEPTIYRSRLNTALSLGCSHGDSEMPSELVRPRSETFSKDQIEQVRWLIYSLNLIMINRTAKHQLYVIPFSCKYFQIKFLYFFIKVSDPKVDIYPLKRTP